MIKIIRSSLLSYWLQCRPISDGSGPDCANGPPAPEYAQTAERFITVSSTTSTTDSGLFNHLLPAFKAKTGIDVRVVSQGTGQALDTGRRGDADVVFVHARAQEQANSWRMALASSERR